MMYITKVQLKDVRCFEDAVIDLSQYEPGTSVLIAGNNGLGKSAILRAIAMGLCDRDSAASLLRELEGNFIRRQAKKSGTKEEKQATIEIDLLDEKNTPWKIRTTVTEWKELIIERVEQEYSSKRRKKEFNTFYSFWDKEGLFVTAYGAGLRTEANTKYVDYFAVDAVYSLFKYDAPLQDPEIAWNRQVAAVRKAGGGESNVIEVNKNISDLLKYVLNLDENAEVKLEPNGIFIKEKNQLIALDAIGDGHKSLIKLTLDILVWYLLKLNYDEEEKGEERNWKPIPIDSVGRPDIRGIVIIDEIEQHLHPKLQRQILKRLHDKFPKVQFIVTTHSPLCVSGTADLGEKGKERCSVFSMRREDDNVTVHPREIPRGLRADQILLDYFELGTTLSLSTEEKLVELESLMNIPKTERLTIQEGKITQLLKEIEGYDFSLAESLRDRKFQKEAFEFLRGQEKKQFRPDQNPRGY